MSQYDQLMAVLAPAMPPLEPPIHATDLSRSWREVGKDTFAALDRGVANVASAPPRQDRPSPGPPIWSTGAAGGIDADACSRARKIRNGAQNQT